MVDVIIKEPIEDDYDDFLNDVYGDVNVAGINRCTSIVLREIDPIMYNIGYDEYCDEYTQYECGKCGVSYDNEEDAEECCKEE